jgi:protein-S-isoprenylcysteine O-methyltransferase Ste14
MNETIYHLTFVSTFLVFTLIRAFYHRRATQSQGKIEYREGRLHRGLRLVTGIPFMIFFFAYMAWPGIGAWAVIPLPEWARWTGAALSILCLPVIWWVQRSLGSNFSTTLHVRQEHTLVTQGPYRWVRHPMYTVLFAWIAGFTLLTANWFIGGVPLAAFLAIVATRIRNEEAVMVEKFGDEYKQYMQQTGRFLPKLDLRQG